MSVPLVRRLAPALIVLVSAATAAAQGRPVQVLDLNTTAAGAGVASPFTRIGEVAYFAGHGLDEGVELWRTDGTEAGTFLAVDIRPGPSSSSPQCITALGSTLYFSADDGIHGPELWRSDGTPAGTHMVVEALPGPEGVSPCQIVESGGLMFFSGGAAFTPSRALWRTDGTAGGTFELRRGPVLEITPFNDEVYFASDDDDYGGWELYASDGTLLGTRRVADLVPGPQDSRPSALTAGPAGVVFRAGRNWDERLWVTDGTEAGTAPLASPEWLCGDPSRVGDEIWFGGFEGDQCNVYRTDGTPEGTELLFPVGEDNLLISPFALAWDQVAVMVHDYDDDEVELRRIDPAGGSVSILQGSAACGGGFGARELTPFDGDLFFAGFSRQSGWKLHRSDGTTAGTIDLGPVFPGYRGPNTSYLTPLGDRLLFAAQDEEHGFEPWITDGTEEGTHLLRDIHLGNSRGVGRIANVDGTVFLQTTRRPRWEVGDTELGGSIQEPELWQTDRSVAGTGPVPWSDAVEWEGLPIATDGALTFFVGRDPGGPFGMWVTDGTPAGTRRLIEYDSPYSPLGSEWGRMVGGRLFFAAAGRAFVSDGSPEGTQEIPLVYPSSDESQVAELGDDLLFVSRDMLWLTDGSASGTRPLGVAGLFVARESPLAVLGDRAFFFVVRSVTGIELWMTDGTTDGTQMVVEVADPRDAQLFPYAITAWRGAIYFGARGTDSGIELWRTDGTAAGTAQISDLLPGIASSDPHSLTPAGHQLFFTADDGAHGRELAVTDGTPGGTRIVADIHPGPIGSDPARLAAVAGDVYFAAHDGVHGRELWFSDGSEAKTRLLGDIRPGSLGSGIRDLTASDHGVLFSAADGRTGPELWRTSCGDGAVEAGEECDEGSANGTAESCCNANCLLLSADLQPGLRCGLDVDEVRLRRRPRLLRAGDRITIRGEIAPGSPLGADGDLRIDVNGADGLYATTTWSRAMCAEHPRSVRCVDPSGDAVVRIFRRDSGSQSFRARLKDLDLPEPLSGPITISFGEVGARPLAASTSECVEAEQRLTCSGD